MNSGWLSGFYQAGEIVLFLIYINVLWVLFSAAGLLLFGVGPSTMAMFTVFRKWAMGRTDMAVFREFWRAYCQQFLRANALIWVLFAFGAAIYTNLNYFVVDNEWLNLLYRYVLFVTAFLYGLMLLYIFPVFVHYETSFFRYFKNALLIALYHPLRSIYIIAAFFTLYHLFFTLPVLILFFGASLTAFIMMWISYRTFIKIDDRQQKIMAEHAV
ncbi:YesL family protein [Alteribacillus sp. HJP-4]|uniref:YesL family protein n=1 Tax=Alteribacillus sp. HJP-4 TaxID=2775394 RepID=UPI0035CD28FA